MESVTTPCIKLRASLHGFTLLELLVVLVIVGMTLGLVTYKMLPDDNRALQEDAQRISLLLQLARDEAIVRNHPVAFEASADRYHFMVQDTDGWQPITQDDTLRERTFKKSPLAFAIAPSANPSQSPLRIVFGREPVDKPFTLTLSSGNAHAAIRADGMGHFTVE